MPCLKASKKIIKKNKEIGDKKSKRLYHSYNLIKLIVIFLLLFSVLLMSDTWIKSQYSKKEDIKMSQSENKNGNVQDANQQNSQQNTSDNKPNPNVKPPKFELVTEGYDPSKIIHRKPTTQQHHTKEE